MIGPGSRLPALWRWRWEIGTLAAVLGIQAGAMLLLTWAWAPAAAPLILAVMLADPHTRRGIRRRVRAVLIQHRLRAALVATGIRSPAGRRPGILWTRPIEGGERVWVWLPLGVGARALEEITEVMATACWAPVVTVRASRHHPQLTAIDLCRRPAGR
jgi:hypothetical protein